MASGSMSRPVSADAPRRPLVRLAIMTPNAARPGVPSKRPVSTVSSVGPSRRRSAAAGIAASISAGPKPSQCAAILAMAMISSAMPRTAS